MTFIQEPTHYQKTVLSDLQGAWSDLRQIVVDSYEFENAAKLLFYIDEATSWESVRDLQAMKSTFILVKNVAAQSEDNQEILAAIEVVQLDLDEALQSLADGDIS